MRWRRHARPIPLLTTTIILLTGSWLTVYRQLSGAACPYVLFNSKREELVHYTMADQTTPWSTRKVVELMHASIARDFGPWLEKAIEKPSPAGCELILIRNGSDIRYLGSTSLPESLHNKARAFDAHVRWVTQRLPLGRARPTSMCIHLGSTPVHHQTLNQAYPTYSLAKSDAHLDIVYPNMYFGYGGSLDDWNAFQRDLTREAASHSYSLRRDQAFWRGTCGSYSYNRGRIHLVLAGRNDTRLDVGFSNQCPMSESKDEDISAAVLKAVNALPTAKFIRPTGMTEYKYLFSMPGSSKGSYSRHLQTALCSNATVLLWDNEFYEFYYSLLQPWVHFVPVSEATLQERLQWLGEHPAEAERIARNGHWFCTTQLTGAAITSYWLQLFTMHALLQAYNVDVEDVADACTCSDIPRGLRCTFC